MPKKRCVGIIAEDKSDFEAVKEIIQKIHTEKIQFRSVYAKGCGNLMRGCDVMANNLILKGCNHIIIVRDSDTNDPEELTTVLNKKLGSKFKDKRAIIIPVVALENWLLSDMAAIHGVFGREKTVPKDMSSPESIPNAKREIGDKVRKLYGKSYVYTVHNVKISRLIDIKKIQRSCKSFQPLYQYVIDNI